MTDNVRQMKNNSELEKLIDGLNEDLANEYAASIMYTYNASVLEGLYRPLLKPFFEDEISDEMGHALYLSNKIKILGGTPTTTPVEVNQYTEPKDMLEDTLKAEEATIKRYQERKEQAEKLGLTELANQLDDMIDDETGHREEAMRLLKDASFSK
ncbi:Ferritin-like domain protein [Paraliobacillus sp. PM-2]|uniref:ferritin-like domain-containing protein n=1 Tax=Paraliobacillus sp. PM-2 TaxID=1462524 RepID=UPI00061CDA74|nr:ferritin-like domain-containing protein [Paraliobacillus sp. PM-2]CQR47033.1 Ferritin-like domain protein [Paraliobacillus sp. PM-2]